MTPEERHIGTDKEILANRKKVYNEAKKSSGKMGKRNQRMEWSFSEEWLNPKQEKETNNGAKAL